MLGNNDEAFRLLFKHAEERNSLNYVKTEPRFDSLHSDPRWQLLLRRMNLPVDSERDTTSNERSASNFESFVPQPRVTAPTS